MRTTRILRRVLETWGDLLSLKLQWKTISVVDVKKYNNKRKKYLGCTLFRYSGPFLKLTGDELRQMDQRTRKLMIMPKALHLRDDVDRLYVPRKERGIGLASIKDSIDTFIQRLEDYIETHERGLITAIRNNTDYMVDNRMTKIRKQKWKENNSMGVLNDE